MIASDSVAEPVPQASQDLQLSPALSPVASSITSPVISPVLSPRIRASVLDTFSEPVTPKALIPKFSLYKKANQKSGSPTLTLPPFWSRLNESPPYKPSAADYFSLDQYNTLERRNRRKLDRARTSGQSANSSRHRMQVRQAPSVQSLEASVVPWDGNVHEQQDEIERAKENEVNLAGHAMHDHSAGVEDVPSILQIARIDHIPTRVSPGYEQFAKALVSDDKRRSSFVSDGLSAQQTLENAFGSLLPTKMGLRKSSMESWRKDDELHDRDSTFESNRALRDGSDRISIQGQRTETPAVITLRRASKMYNIHDSQQNRGNNNDSRGDSILSKSLKAPEGQHNLVDSIRYTFGHLTKAQQESDVPRIHDTPIISSSKAPSICSQSRVVDTALTMSEIHGSITPARSSHQSFGKSSSTADLASKKSNLALIRSRGSLHEIIWKGDHTPSSCMSTGNSHSASSESDQTLEYTKIEYMKNGKKFQKKSRTWGPIGNLESIPSEEYPSLSMSSKVLESPKLVSLCGWAWSQALEEPGPSIAHAKEQQPALQKTQDKPEAAHKPNRKERMHKRSSILEAIRTASMTSGTESFPPPPNNQTTQDWQSIFGADWFEGQLLIHSDPGETAESPNALSRRENDSDARPDDRPSSLDEWIRSAGGGARQLNKVGSAIGLSSHVHRKSHGHSIQRSRSTISGFMDATDRRTSQARDSLMRRSLGIMWLPFENE